MKRSELAYAGEPSIFALTTESVHHGEGYLYIDQEPLDGERETYQYHILKRVITIGDHLVTGRFGKLKVLPIHVDGG